MAITGYRKGLRWRPMFDPQQKGSDLRARKNKLIIVSNYKINFDIL